jgi:hypothetical protein
VYGKPEWGPLSSGGVKDGYAWRLKAQGFTMTAIVAACYKGGIVIGSESRTVNYSERHGDIVTEGKAKVASLKALKTVLGFAGEINLTFTYIPTNDKLIAMSLPEFIMMKMINSSESGEQLVIGCIREFVNVLNFMQEPGKRTIDVVFGLGGTMGTIPTLFRFRVDGPPWQSRKVEPDGVCLGAGIWDQYHAFATKNIKFFIDADRERLARLNAEGLVTPPLPNKRFDTRDDAEQWLREVIRWCCVAFPMFCSGEFQITDTNTDLFKFRGD